VTLELAVLVQGTAVRSVVPRSIGCPSVEQYAAALTAGFARNNLMPRTATVEQWYRTSLVFRWDR
jgi:hypothetical protein